MRVKEIEEIITKISAIREKLERYIEERAKQLGNIKTELEKLDKLVDENFQNQTEQK